MLTNSSSFTHAVSCFTSILAVHCVKISSRFFCSCNFFRLSNMVCRKVPPSTLLSFSLFCLSFCIMSFSSCGRLCFALKCWSLLSQKATGEGGVRRRVVSHYIHSQLRGACTHMCNTYIYACMYCSNCITVTVLLHQVGRVVRGAVGNLDSLMEWKIISVGTQRAMLVKSLLTQHQI